LNVSDTLKNMLQGLDSEKEEGDWPVVPIKACYHDPEDKDLAKKLCDGCKGKVKVSLAKVKHRCWCMPPVHS
jgi:hypothetical protein